MSIEINEGGNSNGIKTNERKQKKIPQKISKNDAKYMEVLKLLNTILVNIEKDPIDDITKFVNIDKEDINKLSLEKLKDETIFLYNIKNRTTEKSIVLNTLRNVIKSIGYNFSYVQKDICEEINGKKYRSSHSFYSIRE